MEFGLVCIVVVVVAVPPAHCILNSRCQRCCLFIGLSLMAMVARFYSIILADGSSSKWNSKIVIWLTAIYVCICVYVFILRTLPNGGRCEDV